MKEIDRIKNQLEKAFWGNAWHGPSVMESLDAINSVKASVRSVDNTHSIWEIVLHTDAWQKVVKTRLNGKNINLSDDEDWSQVISKDENSWNITLTTLAENFKTLLESVSTFDESALNEMVIRQSYSNYFMLHGLVQHYVYHAGQISLLKKF